MSFEGGFERTLGAAREGSDWAWEEIYAELAPPAASYLYASRVADPEDVLGEVFLQMVRDIGRFEGDERDFRAWVLTIAHHRLVDAKRLQGRRPEAPDTGALEVGAPTGDVEREALERLGLERVESLLAGLTGDQQAVLLLRIVGDLAVEQVAEVLGKRPGAIKQLQRRGLAAVQRELECQGVTQ